MAQKIAKRSSDLIETYWNVNYEVSGTKIVFGDGFNRDILECKFDMQKKKFIERMDLIETYWNVNINVVQNLLVAYIDLIETYWNVNKMKALAAAVTEQI